MRRWPYRRAERLGRKVRRVLENQLERSVYALRPRRQAGSTRRRRCLRTDVRRAFRTDTKQTMEQRGTDTSNKDVNKQAV